MAQPSGKPPLPAKPKGLNPFTAAAAAAAAAPASSTAAAAAGGGAAAGGRKPRPALPAKPQKLKRLSMELIQAQHPTATVPSPATATAAPATAPAPTHAHAQSGPASAARTAAAHSPAATNPFAAGAAHHATSAPPTTATTTAATATPTTTTTAASSPGKLPQPQAASLIASPMLKTTGPLPTPKRGSSSKPSTAPATSAAASAPTAPAAPPSALPVTATETKRPSGGKLNPFAEAAAAAAATVTTSTLAAPPARSPQTQRRADPSTSRPASAADTIPTPPKADSLSNRETKTSTQDSVSLPYHATAAGPSEQPTDTSHVQSVSTASPPAQTASAPVEPPQTSMQPTHSHETATNVPNGDAQSQQADETAAPPSAPEDQAGYTPQHQPAGAADETPALYQAQVLYHFKAQAPDELTLAIGDVVDVLQDGGSEDWWVGRHKGRKGAFPGGYVQRLAHSTAADGGYVTVGKGAHDVTDASVSCATVGALDSACLSPSTENGTLPATPTEIRSPQESGESGDYVQVMRYGITTQPAARALPTANGSSHPGTSAAAGSTTPADGTGRPSSPDSDADGGDAGDYDNLDESLPLERSAAGSNTAAARAAATLSQQLESVAVNGQADASEAAAAEEEEEDEEMEEEEPVFARVLFDYKAATDSEIALKAGELVELIVFEEGDGWWSGFVDDREGWFPANYVKVLTGNEAVQAAGSNTQAELDSWKLEKRSRQRAELVKEIVNTEADYVQDLEVMVRHYVIPMRQRIGSLFAEESIDIIFCNVESIHKHNQQFLKDLRAAAEADEVGLCFLQRADRFRIYSRYCTNHDRAVRELQRVTEGDLQIESFFEGCRLMGGKTLDLSSFLLKPVQRVLRYRMLLEKLQDLTSKTHKDYESIAKAHQHMSEIALQINEGKRYKEEIIRLQSLLDNWIGRPLSECCSQLIYDGDLMKVSNNHMQERHFFLFDNLFLYCKRMMKGRFTVRGKIFTENMTVIDVEDGTIRHRSTTLTNAFRVRNETKNKWYILVARSKEDKDQWLDAFLRERKQVEGAKIAGLSLVNQAVDEVDDKTPAKLKQDRTEVVKKFDRKTLKTARKKPGA